MGDVPSRRGWGEWQANALPVILLGVLVVLMFLAAPGRLGVVNDEMLHLESWRNRYHDPIIYPLIMQKLRDTGRLSPQAFARFERLMAEHRWLQRAVLSQFGEGFPPLYGWLAEGMAAVSDSSLVAMRSMSVVGALLCLVALYLLGWELRGHGLGCWLASMQAICYLTQTYAGIGRAYALGQGTLALTLWVYVRWAARPRSGPAGVLAAALLAKSLVWMSWPIIFPIVMHVVIRTWREAEHPVMALARRTWWYVAGSLALMPFLAVEMFNPTVTKQGSRLVPGEMYTALASASPFGHLLSFGEAAAAAGLVVLAVLIVIGVVVLARSSWADGCKWGLLAALACGAVTLVLWAPLDRRMMFWMVVLGIFAGIGGWWVSGQDKPRGLAVLSAVLVAFLAISWWHPVDPYEGTFKDPDYAAAARCLRTELGPEDVWISYPYYTANPLYHYEKLPEPIWPMSEGQFLEALQHRPGGTRRTFVWMSPLDGHAQQALTGPALAEADRVWRFGNGFVLLRLRPGEGAAETERH